MVQREALSNKRATGREEEPSLLGRLVRRLAFSPQAPRPPTPPSSGYEETPPPSPSAAAWAAESPRRSPSTFPSPWSAGASSLVKSLRDSPASVASPRASSSVASPRAAGSGAASADSSRAASPTSVVAASPSVVAASGDIESSRAASPSSAGGASPSVAGSPRAVDDGAASSSDANPDALGLSLSPRSLVAGHSSPTGLSSSSASPLSSPCAASPAPSSGVASGAASPAPSSSVASSVAMLGASPAPLSVASGASPAPSSVAMLGASPAPSSTVASAAASSVAASGASPSVAGSPRAAVDGAASASPSVASSSSGFGPGTIKYVPGVGCVTREEYLASKGKKRAPSVEDDEVSVSSNESAGTRARYKKLGYDSKTLRKPPKPPARHPSSGHKNTYDPDEDTEGEFPVRRLLDRRGKPPKLYYLVEWNCDSCKLSWVLESDLRDCDADKQVVDDYKASRASRVTRSSVTLSKFSKQYREATASVSGLCFFEAIQAAVYMLGRPGILPLRVWNQFEETRGADSTVGVTKSDITSFFRFLRKVGCPIDIPAIQPNRLNRSTTTLRQLVDFARGLPEGWYVVHAGEYLEEHCFALRVQAAGTEPIVIDRFVEAEDPPCHLEPVGNLQWIRRVISIRRVQLLPESWVPNKKRRNT